MIEYAGRGSSAPGGHRRLVSALLSLTIVGLLVFMSAPTISPTLAGVWPPHAVFGYTYTADGVTPLPGCVVTITNLRTMDSIIWNETHAEWDPSLNFYIVYTYEFVNGCYFGDMLNVTATKGSLIGWNEAPITDGQGFDWIDVVLNAEAFTLNLVTGRNLVSLPLLYYGYRAGTLGLSPGDTVSKWNSTTKTYMNHIVGLPVNNFAIISGAGYEINVPTGTRTLTIYGTIPTATQHIDINVPASGGWAMVGFVGDNTTRHASDLPHMYSVPGAIVAVSTWNPVTKIFTNWLPIIPYLNDYVLKPGLAYWVSATANGTLSYVPVAPPAASFTWTMDGRTVNVDASASSGRCGIVSYVWDWGDGTVPDVSSSSTTSHTYGVPQGSVPGPPPPTGMWDFPYGIVGWIHDSDGNPLSGCLVSVTNKRTGDFRITASDGDGFYQVEVGYLYWWQDGDRIEVTAVKGDMFGSNWAVFDWYSGYSWMDVTVRMPGPELISLAVTDSLGRTSTVAQSVAVSEWTPGPTLTSPANGATDVPWTSNFTWIAPEGTNYHEIYFDRGGYWSLACHSNTSSIALTFTPATTLSWCVRSSSDGGLSYGPWSEIWSFTTFSGAPTLVSPKGENVSVNAVLTWISCEGANYNEVYIHTWYTDAYYYTAESSFDPEFSPGVVYMWSVRSSFDGGLTYGAWSPTWWLKTAS